VSHITFAARRSLGTGLPPGTDKRPVANRHRDRTANRRQGHTWPCRRPSPRILELPEADQHRTFSGAQMRIADGSPLLDPALRSPRLKVASRNLHNSSSGRSFKAPGIMHMPTSCVAHVPGVVR